MSQENSLNISSRDKKQQELIYIWKTTKNREGKICNGTICAVGGFGKTNMVIEYVFKPIQQKIDLSMYETPFIVIVPKIDLLVQWENRCKEKGINNVYCTTVQSLIKSKKLFQCKLVVYDEIHRYSSTEFKKCFSNLLIHSEWRLGLSGSLNEKLRYFLREKDLPIVAELTEQEAISNGWVCDYKEYNLPIYLDKNTSLTLKNIQDEYNKKLILLSTDRPDWSIIGKVLEYKTNILGKKEYPYAKQIAQLKNLDVGVIIGAAISLRKLIQERKKIIYNYPKKIEVTKQIIDLFPNKKIVTFSLENDFVDKLSQYCGGISLHGGIGTKKKQKEILDNFYSSKSGVLHTCFKLSEGTDIPDLEIGINVSYYSSWVSNVQKIWRVTRKIDNKEPIFINLYLKYHPSINDITQEEYWLIKQQQNRKRNVKWIENINDLYE